MKSINRAARQRAFLKFLMFFVVTFALILITIIFSAQVPLKENKKLKDEQLAMDNEKDFLASFENNVQQTINLLNALDTLKNYAATDVAIDTKIKDLYAQIQDKKDTISVKNLCILILDNLSNYHLVKIDLRKNYGDDETTQQLRVKISELDKLWRECINDKASRASAGN
jgi:hypothetical protein